MILLLRLILLKYCINFYFFNIRETSNPLILVKEKTNLH